MCSCYRGKEQDLWTPNPVGEVFPDKRGVRDKWYEVWPHRKEFRLDCEGTGS